MVWVRKFSFLKRIKFKTCDEIFFVKSQYVLNIVKYNFVDFVSLATPFDLLGKNGVIKIKEFAILQKYDICEYHTLYFEK